MLCFACGLVMDFDETRQRQPGRRQTREQGGSSLPRKMLGIEWLNSMLNNPESFCSSCANAQQNISCHGRRGSGGIGSSAAALGAARRASSVGATDERAPLFGERQPGWGTALPCGGVSRPMAGDAGLVGGGLSFERARRLDWVE